jgi:hypothetical protein
MIESWALYVFVKKMAEFSATIDCSEPSKGSNIFLNPVLII